MRFLGEGASVYAWKNIHLNKSRVMLFLTLLALAFMLFILNTFPYNSVGVVLIPVAYGLGAYTYHKKLLWESGGRAEKAVAKVLDTLDDSHARISRIRIPPNRGDADHIVLAENGIFVFEVKNITGVVECEGDGWRRYKIGRGGKRYDIKIGNPSMQAKRNAKTLKDLIIANKKQLFTRPAPHIWVHAAVVFPDETRIECKNPTVDVIKTSDAADYVRNAKSETAYTQEEIARIGSLLCETCLEN